MEIMQVMFQLAEFALVELGRIVFVTLDCVVLDVAAQQPVDVVGRSGLLFFRAFFLTVIDYRRRALFLTVIDYRRR